MTSAVARCCGVKSAGFQFEFAMRTLTTEAQRHREKTKRRDGMKNYAALSVVNLSGTVIHYPSLFSLCLCASVVRVFDFGCGSVGFDSAYSQSTGWIVGIQNPI